MKTLKALSLLSLFTFLAAACSTSPEPAPDTNAPVKNELTGGNQQIWSPVSDKIQIIEVFDNGTQSTIQLDAAQRSELEMQLTSNELPGGGFLFNTNGSFKALNAGQEVNNPVFEGTFSVTNNGQSLNLTIPPNPAVTFKIVSLNAAGLNLEFDFDVDFQSMDVTVTFQQLYSR